MMDYNQAELYAVTGNMLKLPGWRGEFYWDYGTHQLMFRNGDYILNSEQLKDKGVRERDDWYYII